MPPVTILLSGGLVLVSGAILGALARFARLPTIVGYLVAGVVLGEYGVGLLPEAHADALDGPITDVTMALVLFVLGGQFRLDKIRGRGRPVLVLAAAQSLVTFVLVTLATWPFIHALTGAILLGILAMEVAPATTVVVLHEYDARGPVADAIQMVTAISDVATIFFFEVALLVLFALSGAPAQPQQVAWDIVGSLFYGVMSGYALIVLQDRVGFGNYSLPLLAVLLLTIGLCQWTGVPHMLVFLVTGAVVANRSRFFEPITTSMDNFAQPAYVAFFVLGGWHLDFRLLSEHWMLAGVYVAVRTVAKVVGARFGEHVSGFHRERERFAPFGLALLSQAGAAIALAQLAGSYDPDLGRQLLNIILAGAVVFELAGPLLLKRVVVTAGEVQLGHLMARPGNAPRSWRRTVGRVLRGPWKQAGDDVSDLTAGHLMRRTFRALPARANMDEMLRYANHCPFNEFPVVYDDGTLAGMIRLKNLSEVVYDPQAADLVIAADVVSVGPGDTHLPADADIDRAADFFSHYPGNTVPVVESDDKLRYLGVLERAEVLRIVRSLRRSEPPPPPRWSQPPPPP